MMMIGNIGALCMCLLFGVVYKYTEYYGYGTLHTSGAYVAIAIYSAPRFGESVLIACAKMPAEVWQ